MRPSRAALAVIVAGVGASNAEPVERATIRGHVVDVRGQAVRGATVRVDGAGATTAADGSFTIRDAIVGAEVVITKDGFAVGLATAAASLGEIVLRPEGGETITVHGEAPTTAQGSVRLTREQLERLPGSGGDLMQALSAMPGVASTAVPLGPTGIAIRGASPQDSQILVDDFEVPALYHDLGFRSIVREDAIESLDYIPGGFDVAYGRATSGIVSLTTRAGDDTPRVQLGGSTDEAGAIVQGHSGRVRYMLALRRSTIDLLLRLFPPLPDFTFSTLPRYYDEQLRIDYRLSPHWDLRLSSIGSDDALELYASKVKSPERRFARRTRFLRTTTAAIFHDGPWSAKIAVSGIAQEEATEIGATQHLRARSPEIAARAELVRSADDLAGLTHATWRLGGELVHTRYAVDVALPQEVREGENPGAIDPDDTALTFKDRVITDGAAAWTALSANLDRRIRLTTGFRIDRFTHSVALQPRADLAIRLSPSLVARISGGAYARPPEYQTELLAPKLGHERATQLIAGTIYEPFEGARVQTSIYATDRLSLITRDDHGDLANRGRGTTYGAEVAASLRRGPWTAWLAYSYSHSTRIDAPGAPSRLFTFDQPHNLEAYASYRYGTWTFGARFRALSGLPYTPITSAIFDSDRNVYIPTYGEANSARGEFHHQLDVRIERQTLWKGIRWTRFLDVQNVYLKQSVVTYFNSYDYSQRVALRWLPIIPAVGFRAEY